MDVRLTSTLTPEHENLAAQIILKAVAAALDLLPIAYSLRIETVDAHVYQHAGPGAGRFLAPQGLSEPASPAGPAPHLSPEAVRDIES